MRDLSAVDGFTTVRTPGFDLNVPIGVAVDVSGNIFVADTLNDSIREISRTGGDFGPVVVGGSSSSPVSMVFLFHATTTLGSTAVLTVQGGAPSGEFIDVGNDTCTAGTTYQANQTCKVNVTITPLGSGTRTGVVELLDGSGNVLALGTVQGTGQ